MRSCLAVVIGLVIGAALSFTMLAVAALAGRSRGNCPEAPVAGWSVRVDVPRAMVQKELLSKQLLVLSQGTFAITDWAGASCGHILIRGEWQGTNGWRLASIGVEVSLLVSEDGTLKVVPVSLWSGQLPLSLRLLPRDWIEPVMQPLEQQLNATVGQQLQGSGLAICDVRAGDYGISIYFCQRGAKATE